jgi:glycosidase
MMIPALRSLLLAAVLLPGLALAARNDAVRAYPPSWWVGMKNPELQLLASGPGIGADALTVEVPQGVVRIGDRALASLNHRVIDLRIDPAATTGDIVLRFTGHKGERRVVVPLAGRRPGSAEREGFGPKDAILNLLPDRFANGDPTNDRVPGLLEAADRSNPAARQGGDLAGMAQSLDYIAGMGFTMIWPTPVLENDQPAYSYHGYAITDLYRVDPRFGSNEDYRDFVAQARAKGIGVIQDIVPNHIGHHHPWASDPPTPTWISNGNRFVETFHGRTAVSDPYAPAVDVENFQHGWFHPTMPDLDQREPVLARYLEQNAIWWIEYADLSGLRVDTYGYSDTAFLQGWLRAILREYPHFSIVGEEWSSNPAVVAHWQAPGRDWSGPARGTPSMMDFPLSEAIRKALTEPEGFTTGMGRIHEMLGNDRLYADPSRLVVFEGNHDKPRIFSVLGEDPAALRAALTLVATLPRIPQFYYGTEVLMTSTVERDDLAARRPFPGGWPGDAVSAFSGEGLSPEQSDMQDWMRRLLRWRASSSAVTEGGFLHYQPRQGAYVYFRRAPDQAVMVIVNRGDQPFEFRRERFEEGLSGSRLAIDVIDGRTIDLDSRPAFAPGSATILELDPNRD